MEQSETPSVDRESLPRNALSNARLGPVPASRLGHLDSGPRRLFTAPQSLRIGTGQTPVHAPRCQRKSRFSGSRHRSTTSATFTTRGHTLTSVRSSHASGAFAPLLAGIHRCRLRRPGDVLPHRRPASRNLHATRLRAPRSTCVDKAGHEPERSSEGERAHYRDDSCGCPPRDVPSTRVAGSICLEVWIATRLFEPAKTPLGCRPAKDDTVDKIEVLSAAPEPLRERRMTPPCAPGLRPSYAALWGIARDVVRLCFRFGVAFF